VGEWGEEKDIFLVGGGGGGGGEHKQPSLTSVFGFELSVSKMDGAAVA